MWICVTSDSLLCQIEGFLFIFLAAAMTAIFDWNKWSKKFFGVNQSFFSFDLHPAIALPIPDKSDISLQQLNKSQRLLRCATISHSVKTMFKQLLTLPEQLGSIRTWTQDLSRTLEADPTTSHPVRVAPNGPLRIRHWASACPDAQAMKTVTRLSPLV